MISVAARPVAPVVGSPASQILIAVISVYNVVTVGNGGCGWVAYKIFWDSGFIPASPYPSDGDPFHRKLIYNPYIYNPLIYIAAVYIIALYILMLSGRVRLARFLQ